MRRVTMVVLPEPVTALTRHSPDSNSTNRRWLGVMWMLSSGFSSTVGFSSRLRLTNSVWQRSCRCNHSTHAHRQCRGPHPVSDRTVLCQRSLLTRGEGIDNVGAKSALKGRLQAAGSVQGRLQVVEAAEHMLTGDAQLGRLCLASLLQSQQQSGFFSTGVLRER